MDPEYPSLAVICSNIGSVLENKGDYDGALKMYERGRAIREKVFES